jgi:hypothetical protein
MAVEKPKEVLSLQAVSNEDRLPCTLDTRVKSLINFIFDMKLIQQSVVQRGYDS